MEDKATAAFLSQCLVINRFSFRLWQINMGGRENLYKTVTNRESPGKRSPLTCEMEPPSKNDGFSEATVVFDDGMRGGGGRVGRVVGSRTPSGRLVITWCGAGWRTFKRKKKIIRNSQFPSLWCSHLSQLFLQSQFNCKCKMNSLRLNLYPYSGHKWYLWHWNTQLPVKPELSDWCPFQTISVQLMQMAIFSDFFSLCTTPWTSHRRWKEGYFLGTADITTLQNIQIWLTASYMSSLHLA